MFSKHDNLIFKTLLVETQIMYYKIYNFKKSYGIYILRNTSSGSQNEYTSFFIASKNDSASRLLNIITSKILQKIAKFGIQLRILIHQRFPVRSAFNFSQILPNKMHGRFLHRGISVSIGQFQNPTSRIRIHIRKQDLSADLLQELHLVGVCHRVDAAGGVQTDVSAEPGVQVRHEGVQGSVFLQRRIEADSGCFCGRLEYSPEDR